MYDKPVVIEVEVRSVFGISKIYPANDAAAKLARIAGTKTLKASDLAAAKELGMVVKEVVTKKLGNVVSKIAIVFDDVPVADSYYGS